MSAEPYELLAELGETALTRCQEGRPEELGELYDRAAAIVATLPEQPPVAARAALERAAAAQADVVRRLSVGLAETQAELDHLRRGRDAARSYGVTAAIGGGRA